MNIRMASPLNNARLAAIARIWILVAAVALIVEFSGFTVEGLTNGQGHPLGRDFLNSWAGAKLVLLGRFADAYDFAAYHDFQQTIVGAAIQMYHYSYPPTMALLTTPFALLPYVPALILWIIGGAAAYAFALRGVLDWPRWALFALATPALMISAQAGQTGAWTAALLGGALCLLDRRPIVAGILIGLLAAKPQLGLLVPFALAAGGHWRAFAAAAVTVLAIAALSIGLFGIESWQAYLAHAEVLGIVILEDGTGVWHRFVSVFVTARRLGADPALAYAMQAIFAIVAATGVVWTWRSKAPANLKYAVLVTGGFLATPYLQDYDLVVATFVVVWAAQSSIVAPTRGEIASWIALILLPIATAPIGKLTGLSLGGLVLVAVFAVLLRATARATQTMASPKIA
jgi:hypothetical protein